MTGFTDRLASVRARLGRAVDNSLLVRTTRRVETTLTRWFRGSRIVRWFLAEPEPVVMVIDLRETYTVGPLLRVLDRAVALGGRVDDRLGTSDAVTAVARRVASAPLRVAGGLLLLLAFGGLVTSVISNGAFGGWLILLGIALLATLEDRSASELAETRLGAAFVATFEPPEPPEERR